MIKKLKNLDGYNAVMDYGNKTLEKDGEDFPYCPLYMFVYENYEEDVAGKLSDQLLIKEIKKHGLNAIEWENEVYISEETMADLMNDIYEDLSIEPMYGLM